MITFKEHDRVVLTEDVPTAKLAAGDVGVVIHVHGEGIAYEVEFLGLDGSTLAIVTLEANRVRAVEKHEVTHARRVA